MMMIMIIIMVMTTTLHACVACAAWAALAAGRRICSTGILGDRDQQRRLCGASSFRPCSPRTSCRPHKCGEGTLWWRHRRGRCECRGGLCARKVTEAHELQQEQTLSCVHVQESWVALHSLMPVCPCLDLAICFASGGRRDWSNLPRAPVGKSTPSR